jgi:hypothetical protein
MLEIVCSKKYLFVEFFHHLNGSQNFRKNAFLLQEWKNEKKKIKIWQEDVGMIKELWY